MINTEFEHRKVWREHYGDIPAGMFIHHKNEDKQDNRIENLELVDALTHKRIHGGCELRDGEWWKPCRKCHVLKPVSTEFYKLKPNAIMSWCRHCCMDNVTRRKKIRDMEKKHKEIMEDAT